jgi:uncharacterized protein (DUF58 family)
MVFSFCVYLLILAATSLSAFFLSSPIGYTPFYMLLTLTVISVVYTLVSLFSITCTKKDDGEIFVRRTVSKYHVELSNNSFLFIPRVSFGFFCDDDTKTVDFSIFPNESRLFEVCVLFDHIGQYQVGLNFLKLYDLLGIFRLKRSQKLKTVTVAPRLVETNSIRLKLGSGGISKITPNYFKVNLNEEKAYSGVREYVPGDSLKNVHWSLTAHTSKYMSRNYEVANKNGLYVFLDLVPPATDIETNRFLYDCLAEAALSVTVLGVKSGLDTALVFSEKSGTRSCPIMSLADAQRLAPMFAQLPFEESCGIVELMKKNIENKTGCENVIVCTANLSSGLVCYLSELRSLHISPVLIYAVPEGYDCAAAGELLRYLFEHGIEYRIIASADELDGTAVVRRTV